MRNSWSALQKATAPVAEYVAKHEALRELTAGVTTMRDSAEPMPFAPKTGRPSIGAMGMASLSPAQNDS